MSDSRGEDAISFLGQAASLYGRFFDDDLMPIAVREITPIPLDELADRFKSVWT